MKTPKSLIDALAAYKSLELVENHLILLEERLIESYVTKQKLEVILIKEYEDVEKIQKLSLKGLFVKILGDHEKQMEIERQEYLHAFLELGEHKSTIKLLEKEKEILSKKLNSKAKIKAKLDQEIKKWEAKLQLSKSPKSVLTIQLNKQIVETYNLKREIHEGLIAGSKAIRSLEKMITFLMDIDTWGKWNDYYADMKQNREFAMSSIDKAQKIASTTKELLLHFESELNDILSHKKIPVHYNLDGLHHFMNIYFENLISDWIIRKEIKNALNSIEGIEDNVNRIIISLNNELKQADISIRYLEEKKLGLIE